MSNVVLVHGAWHGAWCWDAVLNELGPRDVEAVAVELPFSGFDDDVAAARSAISSAGPDVVVCAHSYGGVVVNEAAVDLRNVGHIVYLAAFINTGDLSAVMAGPLPLLDGIIDLGGGQSRFDPDLAHQIFYGDSDAATVAAITPRLRPMVLEGAVIAGPRPPPGLGSVHLRGLRAGSGHLTAGAVRHGRAVDDGHRVAHRSLALPDPARRGGRSPAGRVPTRCHPLRRWASAGQPSSLPITDTKDSISPGYPPRLWVMAKPRSVVPI
jgi:Alpha/beta hydrolase family